MEALQPHVGESLGPVRVTPEVASAQEPAAGPEEHEGVRPILNEGVRCSVRSGMMTAGMPMTRLPACDLGGHRNLPAGPSGRAGRAAFDGPRLCTDLTALTAAVPRTKRDTSLAQPSRRPRRPSPPTPQRAPTR